MAGNPMKKGLIASILVALILFAFGRGVWALGDKSLWWDESLSLHRAQDSLAYVLSNEILLTDGVTDISTVDNHPPLYFLLLWMAVRLFGLSEFSLRFLSVGFAVLLVPLLYLTGKRLVDERAGLAAAAFGALSPMYLWYGQELRMYSMLAAMGLLSFYCLIRAFSPGRESVAVRSRWLWIVAYLLAAVGLVLTHYLSALLIIFELMALGWVLLRRSGSRRAIGLTIAVVVVGLAPLLVYAWSVLPHRDDLYGFSYLAPWVLLRDLLNSFSLGLSVDVGDWYVLLIDLLFLLVAVIGLVALVRHAAPRRWRTAGWLLAGYLLVPVALIYLLSFLQPAYLSSRHQVYVSPAFYLLLGVGLTRGRGPSLGLTAVAALVMLGGIGYSTANYFSDSGYDKDNHRAWGQYLRQQVRPGDVVVVNPPQIAEIYEYYAASDVPWIGLPLLGRSQKQTEAKLQELLEEYDRIWLAVSTTPHWGDPERLPETWLDENAFRFDYRQFHSYASAVHIAGYLPAWPSVDRLPEDAVPWESQFSSALSLKGYRIITEAESGLDLHLELFWSVEEPIPEQASVQLRLVDGQGHLWGQVDDCPFNALYPMWQWQPGVLLRDEHRLPLLAGMPPGVYELELGLARRPDGCAGGSGPSIEPLLVPPQTRRGQGILLGPVEVQPAATPPTIDDLEIENRHRSTFDGLRLLGSHLPSAGLDPGSRFEVALYWEVRQPPQHDAKVRLRLLHGNGLLQEEAVIRPVGGNHPAHLWRAGERLQGKFWLTVPTDVPPGRYTVELSPEAPLRASGLWPALQQLLGSEPAIELGSLDVTTAHFDRPVQGPTAIPTPANLAVAYPLVASFGDQVRFLGYDLESATVRAEATLSFTLYWQALAGMDTSYTVFTHLLDHAEQVWGQKDGPPLDGDHPTTEWQPGEVIVDPYSFVVSPEAPPGTYLLEIGLYHPESAARLPVRDADGQPVWGDRIILSDVIVLSPLTPTP
jgi:hypothetical protein